MIENLLQWLTSVSLAAGIFFGVIAAWRNVDELRRRNEELARSTKEAARRLSWEKIREAKSLLDGLRHDTQSQNALKMTNVTGLNFETDDGSVISVTWSDISDALEPTRVELDDKAVWIRLQYLALFHQIVMLEHYVQTGLVEFRHLRDPLSYAMKRLKNHEAATEVFGFAEWLEQSSVAAFCERFEN